MKRSIINILASVGLSLFVFGCSGSVVRQIDANNNSVYDRVMKSGVIRCGYVFYSPICMKDPKTGELCGIGIDTLELAAKNLGLKVEWTEEVGWGSMIEGLETNRYDLVASLAWANSTRAREADFSKPLYYSPIFAYVRKGDRRLDGNIAALNSPKFTIATIDGETAAVIAKEEFPQAKISSLPQLAEATQMMLTVTTGKADVNLTEPSIIAEFMKNNPGTLDQVKTDGPLRVYPDCWLFKRGQMEFKNMMDTALEQLINSGAVDKIISKYEPEPNVFYRVAIPYQLPAKAGK